jgi:hypothetical protein
MLLTSHRNHLLRGAAFLPIQLCDDLVQGKRDHSWGSFAVGVISLQLNLEESDGFAGAKRRLRFRFDG